MPDFSRRLDKLEARSVVANAVPARRVIVESEEEAKKICLDDMAAMKAGRPEELIIVRVLIDPRGGQA